MQEIYAAVMYYSSFLFSFNTLYMPTTMSSNLFWTDIWFFSSFFLQKSRTSGEMDGAIQKLLIKCPSLDPNCTKEFNKVLLQNFGLIKFYGFWVNGQFGQFLQSCLQHQIMKHHHFFPILYGLSTTISREIADDY